MALVCLMNIERAANGLAPLSWNWPLYGAARGMAARMVELSFFSHVEPDGTPLLGRVEPTGYLPHRGNNWTIGENLGWGEGVLGTPGAVVAGWMASPEHRANVLAPDYRDVGVGYAEGSPVSGHRGGAVYTAEFGRSVESAAPSRARRVLKPAARRGQVKPRHR